MASGLAREPWAYAQPVRGVFREAFARAGLPYFNPHSFRNTLVQRAYELRLDAEQFKAWSQNLGHEHVLTTFCSYGALPDHRQAEIIRELGKPTGFESNGEQDPLEQIASILARVKKSA